MKIRFVCELKLSYLFLLSNTLSSKNVKSDYECDEYLYIDSNENNATFFTITGHRLPRSKYTRKLHENITCPCNEIHQFCLRKCCLANEIFMKKKCRSNDITSIEDGKFDLESIPNIPSTDYTMIYGSYCRSTTHSLEKFSITEDGSVLLNGKDLPMNEYCVDYFADTKDIRLLKCENPEIVSIEINSVPKIFTIGLSLSIFCLIITFIIYSCIDKLRNLQGKVLLCYVSSLVTTEASFLILQIFSLTSGTICVITAYTSQFSFLATFFWLNVMCFDLWLAFRGHWSLKQSPGADFSNKRFTLYCLYAWGIPLAISITTMLIELSIIPGNFVKPNFGQTTCWFKTHEARFWYFYSFISVILLLNLYMFFATALIIFKKEKIREVFKESDSKRHNEQEKQRFFRYLKLFLMMGINWTMEVLSYYMQDFENLKYIWYITDLTNTLQGFLILVIFVCNKKVLALLNRTIYPRKRLVTEKRTMCRNLSYSTSTTMCSQRGNAQSSSEIKIDAYPLQREKQEKT